MSSGAVEEFQAYRLSHSLFVWINSTPMSGASKKQQSPGWVCFFWVLSLTPWMNPQQHPPLHPALQFLKKINYSSEVENRPPSIIKVIWLSWICSDKSKIFTFPHKLVGGRFGEHCSSILSHRHKVRGSKCQHLPTLFLLAWQGQGQRAGKDRKWNGCSLRLKPRNSEGVHLVQDRESFPGASDSAKCTSWSSQSQPHLL
jgi:hypothetical protein